MAKHCPMRANEDTEPSEEARRRISYCDEQSVGGMSFVD